MKIHHDSDIEHFNLPFNRIKFVLMTHSPVFN